MRGSLKKGMTLIEIIIAIALLGIIAVSMLGIFANSFAMIFNYGRKSTALGKANSIMDKVYRKSSTGSYTTTSQVQDMIAAVLQEEGYADVASALSSDAGKPRYKKYASLTGISDITGTEMIRYYVSAETTNSGVAGFNIALVSFHSDHKRIVTLRNFLIKGGS